MTESRTEASSLSGRCRSTTAISCQERAVNSSGKAVFHRRMVLASRRAYPDLVLSALIPAPRTS